MNKTFCASLSLVSCSLLAFSSCSWRLSSNEDGSFTLGGDDALILFDDDGVTGGEVTHEFPSLGSILSVELDGKKGISITLKPTSEEDGVFAGVSFSTSDELQYEFETEEERDKAFAELFKGNKEAGLGIEFK